MDDEYGLKLVFSVENKATGEIKQITSDLDNLEAKVKDTKQTLDDATSTFNLAAFTATADRIGSALTSVGESIISGFSGAVGQVYQVGSTLAMAEMQLNQLYQGSGQTGKDVMKQIQDYASETMFSFESLLPMVAMLKASGIDAFESIGTSTGKTNQLLLDYASDLAAFAPNMRNQYGSGLNAALGAVKEFVGEGNTMSLKRGAGLDIDSMLGGGMASTREGRYAQVMDAFNDYITNGTSQIFLGDKAVNLKDIVGQVGKGANKRADVGATEEIRRAQINDAFYDFIESGQKQFYFSTGKSVTDAEKYLGLTAEVGKTPEERAQQLADAFERINITGMTAGMRNSPQVMLANFGDYWFQFLGKISDSGVYDAITKILGVVSDYIKELVDSGRMDKLAEILGGSFTDILMSTIPLIETFFDVLIRFIDFASKHPKLADGMIKGALALGVLATGIGLLLSAVAGAGAFLLFAQTFQKTFGLSGGIGGIGKALANMGKAGASATGKINAGALDLSKFFLAETTVGGEGTFGSLLFSEIGTAGGATFATAFFASVASAFAGGAIGGFIDRNIMAPFLEEINDPDAKWYSEFTWFKEGGFFPTLLETGWDPSVYLDAFSMWGQDLARDYETYVFGPLRDKAHELWLGFTKEQVEFNDDGSYEYTEKDGTKGGVTSKGSAWHTFAEGGIVSSPTFSLVGEDGAEAIMPLERNTGWITNLARSIVAEGGTGGGSNVTFGEGAIQITVANASEAEAESLANRIMELIARKTELNEMAMYS